MSNHVAVIGAGPAGMLAALFALRAGARVTVLDRNEKPGKKLYITGKGRCNVSNAALGEEFLSNVPRNPRFLYAALSFFSPVDLRTLLDSLGCPTVVERGQRVFPASQKASDITRALQRGVEKADIRFHARVSSLVQNTAGGWTIAVEEGPPVNADAVVIATGGLSYAGTGSTGDGYAWAQTQGHRLTERHAALVPLETSDAWLPLVQGLSLKNVSLSAFSGTKKLFEEQGEMLFSHFGVTGPLVLSMSSYLAGMDLRKVTAAIDMKPALSPEQLRERLKRMLSEGNRKQLKSLLPELLPGHLVEAFMRICPIDWQIQCAQTSADARERIISSLKRIPLTLTKPRPIMEAVITRGGIHTGDVSPSTMMSRIVPGLFFAGEVLDVDALTGGFNLQIAFSTGALAGEHAAHYATKE